MKRFLCLIASLGILLCACASAPQETSAPTQAPTTVPTVPTTLPPETQPQTTAPLHSPLYLEGVDVEDVIAYFNEVCLNAEYTDSGDPSVLQKWTAPICYYIHGPATEADLAVFEGFVQWLNTIEGFPGMYAAEEAPQATLSVYFCTRDELLQILGDNFTNADAGVRFWYEADEIYTGTICYRTDLDQELRNSVILEEIYNGLGPVQDSDLREDSIIYSGFTMPQSLTAIDELILKLLYHPQMQCSMNAEACAQVIRQLYY